MHGVCERYDRLRLALASIMLGLIAALSETWSTNVGALNPRTVQGTSLNEFDVDSLATADEFHVRGREGGHLSREESR